MLWNFQHNNSRVVVITKEIYVINHILWVFSQFIFIIMQMLNLIAFKCII